MLIYQKKQIGIISTILTKKLHLNFIIIKSGCQFLTTVDISYCIKLQRASIKSGYLLVYLLTYDLNEMVPMNKCWGEASKYCQSTDNE